MAWPRIKGVELPTTQKKEVVDEDEFDFMDEVGGIFV